MEPQTIVLGWLQGYYHQSHILTLYGRRVSNTEWDFYAMGSEQPTLKFSVKPQNGQMLQDRELVKLRGQMHPFIVNLNEEVGQNCLCPKLSDKKRIQQDSADYWKLKDIKLDKSMIQWKCMYKN